MNTKAALTANDWYFLIAVLTLIALFIYLLLSGKAFT